MKYFHNKTFSFQNISISKYFDFTPYFNKNHSECTFKDVIPAIDVMCDQPNDGVKNAGLFRKAQIDCCTCNTCCHKMFSIRDSFKGYQSIDEKFKFDFVKPRPGPDSNLKVTEAGNGLSNNFRKHLREAHGIDAEVLEDQYPFFQFVNSKPKAASDAPKKTTAPKKAPKKN